MFLYYLREFSHNNLAVVVLYFPHLAQHFIDLVFLASHSKARKFTPLSLNSPWKSRLFRTCVKKNLLFMKIPLKNKNSEENLAQKSPQDINFLQNHKALNRTKDTSPLYQLLTNLLLRGHSNNT